MDEDNDATTYVPGAFPDDNNFSSICSDVYESLMIDTPVVPICALEDDGQRGANITITQVPFASLVLGPAAQQICLDFRTRATSDLHLDGP